MLCDGVCVLRHECVGSRVLQDFENRVQAVHQLEELAGPWPDIEALNLLLEELSNQNAKHAVFAQHLMHRCALNLAKTPELGRPRRDDSVRGNRLVRRQLKIRGELVDDRLCVILRLFAGKDIVWSDWNDLREVLDPAFRQRFARRLDPLRDQSSEVGRNGICHGLPQCERRQNLRLRAGSSSDRLPADRFGAEAPEARSCDAGNTRARSFFDRVELDSDLMSVASAHPRDD